MAIDVRLAGAEQIEVWAVEYVDRPGHRPPRILPVLINLSPCKVLRAL
jgi:hypothetical protein